eukprot:11754521-Prorocentrum_lima.AAC.1
MTSSLVGSEMCIRDSFWALPKGLCGEQEAPAETQEKNFRSRVVGWPVSYTHLTLPTICSVDL